MEAEIKKILTLRKSGRLDSERTVSQYKKWDRHFHPQFQKLQLQHFEMVVARYRENISWLSLCPHLGTVYQKNPAYQGEGGIGLPNIGREAHTYLHHIVTHWDRLSDKTLFTQAGLIPDHYHLPICYYYLSRRPITLYLGCHQTTCQGGWGHLTWKGSRRVGHPSDLRRSEWTFGEWWDRYVKKTRPSLLSFQWSPGAIFSVSRQCIKSQPLAYYQNLLSSIPEHSNPEEGHYFERAWYYIFS